MDGREQEKRAAAEAATLLVQDGMTVGLGTGSTVAHFLPALARRQLAITCVATSVSTETTARSLGLALDPFDAVDRLDLVVDGADQVAPDLWLIKGRGGAHLREKIAAAAADRFVVIVSSDKLVGEIGPPVPLEVLSFGLGATIRTLSSFGEVRTRHGVTPDGNVLLDFYAPVDDPEQLSGTLDAVPGVVGHGLFAPNLVAEVLVGKADGSVDRLTS
ncbi:MAG TPA: ribose-5-phosphate isomerase RpiA [Actinomycetota bacterium]|nr:ribose-5-phosphate isomerase RpiA [Actinomycetota bacterium]